MEHMEAQGRRHHIVVVLKVKRGNSLNKTAPRPVGEYLCRMHTTGAPCAPFEVIILATARSSPLHKNTQTGLKNTRHQAHVCFPQLP
jgi:hypothetical protein